jgi:aryl-alcohol dehydrogenase-like predicted oxidoreductase
MLNGFATAEGTGGYRERFPEIAEAGHFRRPETVPYAESLWFPSLGLGTYLGEPDAAADAEYVAAITLALGSGINLLDTAINYRHQRSERKIGEALAETVAAGRVGRDEVIVCTKAGYLSFDGNVPLNPRAYFLQEYIETGVVEPSEVVGGMHCIAPRYLANQIERSLRNLRLDCIDVFYLHNPETQLAEVTPEVFRHRIHAAFAALEGLVREGKLRAFGLATWNAFRVPAGSRDSINLEEMEAVAREAGGEDHHFRFVQLPFNLAMPEAFVLANQTYRHKNVSLLKAAQDLGIAVVGSATLYQGRLAQGLPPHIREKLGLKADAQNAIQFSRSSPGMVTSLVGMGLQEHVRQNARTLLAPRLRPELWESLFDQKA